MHIRVAKPRGKDLRGARHVPRRAAPRWNFQGGPRHKIEVKKLIGISRSFHQKISPQINLISSKQLIFIDLEPFLTVYEIWF